MGSYTNSQNSFGTSSVSPENEDASGNSTASSTDGLRLNTAMAEEGSDGLGGGARVVRVEPFSSRIAAVSASQGGSLADEAFSGDTTFDQAEGLRLGTFTVLPEVTIMGVLSDNLSQSRSKTDGTSYSISPNLSATSNWSRHQLDFGLRGTFSEDSRKGKDASKSLDMDAALRLDVGDETTVNARVNYGLSQEGGSTAEAGYVESDEHTHSYGGELGVTRQAGIVGVTLRGAIDRAVYDDDKSRNNTVYTASLRMDAETGAIISPFAEGSVFTRRYDEKTSGDSRNSKGYQLRTGLAIGSGSKLNGEVGVGWRQEVLEDDALDDLAGLTVDGSLVWSPTRLTTVTAGLSSSFEATTLAQSSGSILYAGDLRVAHGFSDRLVGDAGVGFRLRHYDGVSIEEQTLTATMGTTFALTKNAALLTRYNYRKFLSSEAGSGYDQSTIEAGIRIRH